MSPSKFYYIKMDFICPLLFHIASPEVLQRPLNQFCPVFLCVPGHSYSTPWFQLLPLLWLSLPISSLGLLMQLLMKHLCLEISQVSLFHHVQRGTHHLPYFFHPSSRTAGSVCVHFRKYYPVVKISNVGVILDSLIQSVANFSSSTS